MNTMNTMTNDRADAIGGCGPISAEELVARIRAAPRDAKADGRSGPAAAFGVAAHDLPASICRCSMLVLDLVGRVGEGFPLPVLEAAGREMLALHLVLNAGVRLCEACPVVSEEPARRDLMPCALAPVTNITTGRGWAKTIAGVRHAAIVRDASAKPRSRLVIVFSERLSTRAMIAAFAKGFVHDGVLRKAHELPDRAPSPAIAERLDARDEVSLALRLPFEARSSCERRVGIERYVVRPDRHLCRHCGAGDEMPLKADALVASLTAINPLNPRPCGLRLKDRPESHVWTTDAPLWRRLFAEILTLNARSRLSPPGRLRPARRLTVEQVLRSDRAARARLLQELFVKNDWAGAHAVRTSFREDEVVRRMREWPKTETRHALLPKENLAQLVLRVRIWLKGVLTSDAYSPLHPGAEEAFAPFAVRSAAAMKTSARSRTASASSASAKSNRSKASEVSDASTASKASKASKTSKGLPGAQRLARTAAATVASASIIALSGCGALTGLDAGESFACPMAAGVSCRSLGETYALADAGLLPHQRASAASVNAPADDPSVRRQPPASAATPSRSPVAGTENVRTERFERPERPAAQPPAAAAAPAAEPEAEPEARGEPAAGHSLRATAAAPVRLEDEADEAGVPRRTPERIVRVWIAPWSDEEGDLHEGHRIRMLLAGASWATPERERDADRPAVVSLPFGFQRGSGGPGRAERSAQAAPGGTDARELREAREAFAEQIRAQFGAAPDGGVSGGRR